MDLNRFKSVVRVMRAKSVKKMRDKEKPWGHQQNIVLMETKKWPNPIAWLYAIGFWAVLAVIITFIQTR